MSTKNYTIEEHTHKYACWAAARAASTSRFTNVEVSYFIKEAGLQEALKTLRSLKNITHLDYKYWYVTQVRTILESMDNYKQPKEKWRKKLYGIAAKIVSIYVKTMEVIPSKGSSAISQVAFPPIDRFLLSVLKRKLDIENISWSTMEEEEYMRLIETLKQFIGGRPFWTLEFYWDLNKPLT